VAPAGSFLYNLQKANEMITSAVPRVL